MPRLRKERVGWVKVKGCPSGGHPHEAEAESGRERGRRWIDNSDWKTELRGRDPAPGFFLNLVPWLLGSPSPESPILHPNPRSHWVSALRGASQRAALPLSFKGWGGRSVEGCVRKGLSARDAARTILPEVGRHSTLSDPSLIPPPPQAPASVPTPLGCLLTLPPLFQHPTRASLQPLEAGTPSTTSSQGCLPNQWKPKSRRIREEGSGCTAKSLAKK